MFEHDSLVEKKLLVKVRVLYNSHEPRCTNNLSIADVSWISRCPEITHLVSEFEDTKGSWTVPQKFQSDYKTDALMDAFEALGNYIMESICDQFDLRQSDVKPRQCEKVGAIRITEIQSILSRSESAHRSWGGVIHSNIWLQSRRKSEVVTAKENMQT